MFHKPVLCRLQATDVGLRRLLALPALVELQVVTFTDDLDMDNDDHDEKTGGKRHENLMCYLGELRATCKALGRRLITTREGCYVDDNVEDD